MSIEEGGRGIEDRVENQPLVALQSSWLVRLGGTYRSSRTKYRLRYFSSLISFSNALVRDFFFVFVIFVFLKNQGTWDLLLNEGEYRRNDLLLRSRLALPLTPPTQDQLLFITSRGAFCYEIRGLFGWHGIYGKIRFLLFFILL